MKKPWESKTLWVNFLLGTLVLFVPGAEDFIAENPSTAIILSALVNIVLRLFTKEQLNIVGLLGGGSK